MASRQASLNGGDWQDVAMNLVAFEVINKVALEIRIRPVDTNGRGDLSITVVANDRSVPIGEAPPLGSASVTCLGTRLRSLEAALIHVMYLLDAKLASGEFAATLQK